MLYKLREWRPALPVAVSETGVPSHHSNDIAKKSQWLSDLYAYLAGWSIPLFVSFFHSSFFELLLDVQMVIYFNVNYLGTVDYPFFSSITPGPDSYTADNKTWHVYLPLPPTSSSFHSTFFPYLLSSVIVARPI